MTDRRVSGSVLWNVAGQVLPALVALVTVPPLIRGLGTERFGLLTIAWVVMGYFSLFDFGMGRATTSAVAAATATGREATLADIVTSSLAAHVTLGVIAGLVLGLTGPALVSVLKISDASRGEAREVFQLLALSVPFVVVTSSLRGVLEGLHRFDAVNVVKIAATAANYVAPLIVLRWTPSLTAVVAVILAGRVLTLLAHAAWVQSSVPLLRGRVRREHVRPMMGFGGWLTVSNTLSPATTAMDRFAIAARLSAAAVTAYATPYEVLTRLYVASSSLMGVMFPLYSAMSASGQDEELQRASRSSARALLLLTAAPVILLIAAADLLLTVWLGPEFGHASTGVARVLLVGVLITTVTQAPATLLQTTGNAARVVRRQIACFALYVPALWLVASRGIVWVAFAWVLRTALEAVLLSMAEQRFHGRAGVDSVVGATLLISITAYAIPLLVVPAGLRIAVATCGALLVTVGMWQFLLDGSDRMRAMAAMRGLLGRIGARP